MSKRAGASFDKRVLEARTLHESGRLNDAIKAYIALKNEDPKAVEVFHLLGVALAQKGMLHDAELILERARLLSPQNPDILFDIAALREAQGRPEESESLLTQVVELAPRRAEVWAALGHYRRDAGDAVASAAHYERAFTEDTTKIEWALQAAILLPAVEGAELLISALEKNPKAEDLLPPLTELLLRSGQIAEAEAVFRTIRHEHEAKDTVAKQLAANYLREKRFAEAASTLYGLLSRAPGEATAWTILSAVRHGMDDFDGAVAAVDRAISLLPTDTSLISLRARYEQHAGRIDAGIAKLNDLAPSLRKKAEVRLSEAILLPPIVDSNEHIDRVRERWLEIMADVQARPTYISEPWEVPALTPYYLGYHGRTDRPLLEAMAGAMIACTPHLEHQAKDLAREPGGKIRVGFVSSHMRRHAVGQVLLGVMAGLDRTKFEVILFQQTDKPGPGHEHGAAAADRAIPLPPTLMAARKAIEAERLDILIFPDLHLNAFTDALSFSRLAPIQATTWGHPGTSGRSTLDYWISCEAWEPAGSEQFYSEKLVRLKQAPYVYERLPESGDLRSRESLGLPSDRNLYGFLQSMFKAHPDFDAYLSSILALDPKSQVLLIGGSHFTWNERLMRRLSKTIDPARITILPKVEHKDYLSVANACDVLLDPIHFGGANTTLEAFRIGKPVITHPGDQMRGRVTAGLYRSIGFEKLIAASAEEYARIAVQTATDSAFQKEASQAILDGHGILFENKAPVVEFGNWIESVVRSPKS